MLRIAVFASGAGSNLKAIIKKCSTFSDKIKVHVVVSNVENAGALKVAQESCIENVVAVPHKNFNSREAFETELNKHLHGVDYIMLAGFMRILSESFVKMWRGRIFNIHPSLLPRFKGAKAVSDALMSGVKTTGATLHIVNEELDGGKILAQSEVEILENDTEESLHARIKAKEHELYGWLVEQLACSSLAL